ncbi:MAG: Cupin domain protein [Betaproteobacteria bacterium ADurb.Bin341]|nr:MAG: Cupin domain protein [Betaproteobacteria bacterium ADurb.Bin341]
MDRYSNFRAGATALALLCLLPFSSPCAADYAAAVKARLITKAEATGNGDKIRYPAFAHPEVSALEVDIAPGGETGWHKHPVPVYAYVLAGRLRVDLEGGQSLTFGPGDAIIEVVDTWHNGRNIGCVPVRLAVFYLGGKDVPNVVVSPTPLGVNAPVPVDNCTPDAP